MNNYENAVLVSYAWGGRSESIVDELECAFAARGIRMVRDKKDLDYKGSIEAFEQYIGRGLCVILVISDKYLRSKHCMYELMVVDKNQNLRDRIFPIVLADAEIYKDIDRARYIKYWDEQIRQLNQAIKEIDCMTNLDGFTADLNKYGKIRSSFDHLTNLLRDMSALTPEIHVANGFSVLIDAVARVMVEKKIVSAQLQSTTSQIQVKTKQVELILEGEFNEFTSSRQQDTIDILAALLKISSTDIRILKVVKGSIAITIEIPDSAANRLYEMAIRRDFKIMNLSIKSIKVKGRKIVKLTDNKLKQSRNPKPMPRRVILANARYWLESLRILKESGKDVLVSETQLRGAALALVAVATIPEAWALTREFTLTLHPLMERLGYWADWESQFQTLILQAQEQADRDAEAELLLMQGSIQKQRGELLGAVLACRRAGQLYRQVNDRHGQASSLSQLGDIYRLQGKFQRAEALCRVALAFFEREDRLSELALAENRLGLVYFDQRRYPETLPHFERAEALNRQVGDWHSLAKTLRNLGELYRRTGDLEKASSYLGEAIQDYLDVGDEVAAARARLNLGNIYLLRGDLRRAETIYTDAETILQHAGDTRDLAGTRLNLGIVYTRLENWDEAVAYFALALEQWRSREDVWRMANTLGEMAAMYRARGDLLEARSCLDKAWQLIGGQKEPHFIRLQQELAEKREELDVLPSEKTDMDGYSS